jgi:outer membrane protein OmpU
MKNTLLCTTALALTGFAGAASAGEVTAGALNVGFSGYYNTGFAYASVGTGANIEAAANVASGTTGGTDFDGVDVFTNAEIHFKPSMVLDNGIKIGIDVQLEAGSNTSGDQIDEAYMDISGDFGKVLIGSENSVGYKMTVAAPDVSMIYASSSSLTAFVPYSGTFTGTLMTPTVTASGAAGTGSVNVTAEAGADLFRGTLGTTYLENNRNNDANRLSYFSPRFGGLQLGMSYARDSGQTNGPVDNNQNLTDIVDIGANYGGEWGGVSVDASARYGIASSGPNSTANDDPEIWGAGLSFGFSNFTFGGSFAEQDGTENADGRAYDVGASYANGPMSYSLTYFEGKNIDNQHGGVLNGQWAYEDLQTIVLAAKYKVNPNFSVGAFIADTQFSEDFDDAGVASGGDDVDGTVLGVTASFSF